MRGQRLQYFRARIARFERIKITLGQEFPPSSKNHTSCIKIALSSSTASPLCPSSHTNYCCHLKPQQVAFSQACNLGPSAIRRNHQLKHYLSGENPFCTLAFRVPQASLSSPMRSTQSPEQRQGRSTEKARRQQTTGDGPSVSAGKPPHHHNP